MNEQSYLAIGKNAQRLYERLSVSIGKATDHVTEQNTLKLSDIEEWQSIVAGHDKSVFNKRLSSLGVTPAELMVLLSSDDDPEKESPSIKWVTQLKQIVELSEKVSPDNFERSLKEYYVMAELPAFWEIVLPFVTWAIQKIYSEANESRHLISHKAELEMKVSLLDQLSLLSIKVLVLELNICRLREQLEGSDPASRYHYFVRRLFCSPTRLLSLFLKYSAWARLLVTVSQNWADAQIELLHRFSQDRAEISAYFFDGEDTGCIKAALSLHFKS